MPRTSSSKANLKSVAEHVQHACTSGYTGIARVTVVGDVGYWYFRRGDIIHALTLDQVGEEAALSMLSWADGNWEVCTRPWPAEASIFLSWVELFQRAGERQQSASPPSTPPPASAPATSALPPGLKPPVSLLPPQAEPPPIGAAQLADLAELATDLVVVERDGRSRTLRGNSEAFAELTSYLSQLCDGIGSELGSGRCHELEVAYRAHSLFVVGRATSTLALSVPRTWDLERVKAKLRT